MMELYIYDKNSIQNLINIFNDIHEYIQNYS